MKMRARGEKRKTTRRTREKAGEHEIDGRNSNGFKRIVFKARRPVSDRQTSARNAKKSVVCMRWGKREKARSWKAEGPSLGKDCAEPKVAHLFAFQSNFVKRSWKRS